MRVQHLDRDEAVEPGVAGEVDRSHPALAENAGDLEAVERLRELGQTRGLYRRRGRGTGDGGQVAFSRLRDVPFPMVTFLTLPLESGLFLHPVRNVSET